MANTNADKIPISLANLDLNNTKMKEYIQKKIDELSTSESITVDTTLSDTSENPVQNKVIKAELDKKANKEIYTDSGISLGRDPDTDLGAKSIAIGNYVTATGATSVAIGNQTVATGSHTTAIGNFTTASGDNSIAINNSTIAQGFNSLAGGLESKAVGNNSIAFGYGIETNKNNSAAFGEYNQSDDNTLFSIGDGDNSDDRHNAFEITKTGGKLHDKDIATTDLATSSTDGLMSATDKKKLDNMVNSGGGISTINDIPPVNGNIALTQSLIPSDGKAYQMPYFVQSGTVTVGKDANTVEITFPKPFKAVPAIVLGTTSLPTDTRYPIIATHNQASVRGFTLIVKVANGSDIIALKQSSTVDWAAFGELAEV